MEEPKKIEITQKNVDQMAFKTGNRRTRRKIAKKYGFYKDKSGEAWRKSNEMIRTDEDASSLDK